MESVTSPAPVPKTWKPTTAGILCIVAGVFNLIAGILVAGLGGTFGGMWGVPWIGAIGAPLIVFGIIAIVGGVFALRRRVWGMALVGGIFSLFPPQIIVLGILAIIFVSLGKKEFS